MEASKRHHLRLACSALLLAFSWTSYASATESLADPQTVGCRTPDAIAGFLAQHITETELAQIAQRENIRRTDLCLLPTDVLRRSVEALRNPLVLSPELSAAQTSSRASAPSAIRKNGTPLQWVNDSPGSHGTVLKIFQNLTTDNELVMFMKDGEVWSSKNNGDTWSLHSSSPYTQHVKTVAAGKLNPKLLVAYSGWTSDPGRVYGLIKSEDGGRNWKRLKPDLDWRWTPQVFIDETEKLILIFSEKKFSQFDFDGNLVFETASIPADSGTRLFQKNGMNIAQFSTKGIYFSHDNGRTWGASAVDSLEKINSLSVHYSSLAAAESDPKTFYASVHHPKEALFRSRNAGQSFETVNSAGYQDLAVNPTNTEHLFAFTNDAAFESLDGGKSMKIVGPVAPYLAFRSPSRKVTPAADFWTGKRNAFVDSTEGLLQTPFGTGENGKHLSQSLSTGTIYQIDNTANGSPLIRESWWVTTLYPTGKHRQIGSFDFVPHPLNDDILIHGTAATWNAGDSYVNFSIPSGFSRPKIAKIENEYRALFFGNGEIYVCGRCLNPNGDSGYRASSQISYSANVSSSPLEPGTHLVHGGSKDAYLVKRLSYANATWAPVNLQTLPGPCCVYITHLSAQVPGLVLAASYGATKPAAIYSSRDHGASWQQQAPLPADIGPLLDFVPSPHDPQTFFVATDFKLVMTQDSGKTWTDIAPVASQFTKLHIENGYLFAGTTSRGRWRAPIISRSKPEKLYVRPALKVARNTQITSTPVLFGTITAPATLAVKNGQHSVGCTSSYRDASVTVQPFDKVCFRHQSSSEFGGTQSTEIDISGFKTAFVSTTDVDEVPDPFTIPAAYDAEPAKPVTSAAVTIKGIGPDAPISIVGGQYSINCTAEFRSSASRITNEARVCVRHTSAAQADAFYTSVLTVGSVSAGFTSKTVGDIAPDAFSFASKNEVPPDTWVVSESKVISGLSSDAAISVTGGEYSIGCTGTFTSTSSRITNGQSVCLRHRAATTPAAQTFTTLNVGSATARFESLTAEDRSPDAFSFAQQSNVALSSVVVSETVTISGISTSVAIRITGGEYSLGCTGTFTSADGLIKNGEKVCVRHTSSAQHSTLTKSTLSVGDRQAEFVSTTQAKPAPANGGGGGGGGGSAGFLLLGLALIRLAKRSH